MIKYPKVYSELYTMQLANFGRSIARIGDGELRLCHMGKHIAQVPSKDLARELCELIMNPKDALVCIPNSEAPNGKPVMWGPTRYSADEYRKLYNPAYHYGSSFVCRPDSAPWIDTPEYWGACQGLWHGKDITLVIGERGGSFTHMAGAKSCRTIYGPERDAYASVDQLMEEIGTPSHSVLICLGPAATILAHRLAIKGVHALDLGHMGRFMPQRFQQG